MKEELTTMMHEEFSVPNDIEIRHRVGSVVTVMSISEDWELEKVLGTYGVTNDDYEKWKDYWK